MEQRQTELERWARARIGERLAIDQADVVVEQISGDASFRRYFRVSVSSLSSPASLSPESFVVADAPPEKEDSRRFTRIAELFRQAGVTVPEIYATDYAQGFLLLQDFGNELYLSRLLAERDQLSNQVDDLYHRAIAALIKLQKKADTASLDPYDGLLLRREMSLFHDWFCGRLLAMTLDKREQTLIEETFAFLEHQALSQPVVAVHRDYHSRNLMIPDTSEQNTDSVPAILDFQDAVAGPYTYDLVSLLRDCYIVWSPEQVSRWSREYLQLAHAAGVLTGVDETLFRRDFDLMGLQRHLKVIGIFSRLAIRDGKPQYLADIPLVINYLLTVADGYQEMKPFATWFRDRVLSAAREHLPGGETCAP
ncbi:MAG: phosphotransferase [Pseudohongiellaceae bacterium]